MLAANLETPAVISKFLSVDGQRCVLLGVSEHDL